MKKECIIYELVYTEGDKISCKIEGVPISEGELHCDNDKWYIRNNIKSGSNSYIGSYLYSWYFEPHQPNNWHVTEVKRLNEEVMYDIY